MDGTGSPPPEIPSHSGSKKSQTSLLTPQALFQSVADQLLGEKTQQQQQAEQKALADAQHRIMQGQQEFQSYQARIQAEEQKRVSETIEMKAQALKVGSYVESSAVRTQTTQGDLSEQTIIAMAMKNAQEAKAREQKARQAMMSASPRKGPQAEGGAQKTNMIAHMQSGSESGDHKLSDDADSRQRQREQAMGE